MKNKKIKLLSATVLAISLTFGATSFLLSKSANQINAAYFDAEETEPLDESENTGPLEEDDNTGPLDDSENTGPLEEDDNTGPLDEGDADTSSSPEETASSEDNGSKQPHEAMSKQVLGALKNTFRDAFNALKQYMKEFLKRFKL